MTDCLACRIHRGELRVPGGVLYDDGLWRVEHAVEPTPMLGWLVAKPLRHVECLDELTPGEAERMGPVLRRMAAALRASGVLPVRPEKVYAVLFAEAAHAPHMHFHLIPRTAADPPERRGPHVFERMREAAANPESAPSPAALQALAARIRAFLQSAASL